MFVENILEVRNLRKEYNNFILKDISFSLKKGYIMGFIGPNGAGKTTTIKLIMNLINRDQGEIKIFGRDNIEKEKSIKNRVGFVYEQNYYYEKLTVKEMKDAVAPFYSNWDEGLFDKYMRKFNLPLNKKMKELSKGM